MWAGYHLVDETTNHALDLLLIQIWFSRLSVVYFSLLVKLQITQLKWAGPFMDPVDVEGLGLHDYYEVSFCAFEVC